MSGPYLRQSYLIVRWEAVAINCGVLSVNTRGFLMLTATCSCYQVLYCPMFPITGTLHMAGGKKVSFRLILKS